MIARQDYKCAATAVPLQPESASLDHKTPRSVGGSNEVDNLHIVHDVVNRSKGDLNWFDFVSMCHAVARTHADPAGEWWTAIDRRRAVFGS